MAIDEHGAGLDDFIQVTHEATLALIVESILEGTTCLALIGAAGAGKTAAARLIRSELAARGRTVILVSRPRAGPLRLSDIAQQIPARPEDQPDSSVRLLEALTCGAEGPRRVLLIDGAEALAPDALEYLRLVSAVAPNTAPQLVLVGRPELLAVQDTRGNFLRKTIVSCWRLDPLDVGRASRFIEQALGTEALPADAIYEAGPAAPEDRAPAALPEPDGATPVDSAAFFRLRQDEPAETDAAPVPPDRIAHPPHAGSHRRLRYAVMAAMVLAVGGAGATFATKITGGPSVQALRQNIGAMAAMAADSLRALRSGDAAPATPEPPSAESNQELSLPVGPRQEPPDDAARIVDQPVHQQAMPEPGAAGSGTGSGLAEAPQEVPPPPPLPTPSEPAHADPAAAPVAATTAATAAATTSLIARIEQPDQVPSDPVLAEGKSSAAAAAGAKTPDRTAPPPAADQPAAASGEIALLLSRADEMLTMGDIVSARLLFEQAADLGNAHAAISAGRTYDPEYLESAQTNGIRGDREAAARWYRIGAALGDKDGNTLATAVLSQTGD